MIEIERRRRGVVVREGRDGYVTRGGRQENVREEKEYGWGGERKVVPLVLTDYEQVIAENVIDPSDITC